MLDLTQTKHAVVVGGGTAGWFAALTLRKLFSPQVKVTVIESASTPIVGVGEGGLVNFISALKFHQINIEEFEQETGAALKLGFSYEGWRNGNASDVYHHTFGSASLPENSFKYRGAHPLSSAMIAHEFRDLSVSIADLDLITQNRSPKEAVERLLESQGLSASFHFDAHKVGAYLKKLAINRHVSHQYGHVTQVGLSSDQNRVDYLKTDKGVRLEADFIIDASGFSRAVLGSKLGVKWQSFKDVLPANRAIPFNLAHSKPNPSLVTRAIAMDHGWMWQIPLKDRVGAGFVYSDRFLSDDAARTEITQKLGFTPEMRAPIHFEAGCFEQVWVSNVLAVGLASGFVEPLEATSIGQMLDQLGAFYRCAQECRALISDQQIDQFNQANLKYWLGVRDFVRMHYDTPRRDTAFWRYLADAPLPPNLAELKATWQRRVPVDCDISAYQSAGWNGMFALQNWITVAGALGLINPKAALRDIQSLNMKDQERVAEFLDTAMHREAELKLGAGKPKNWTHAP